MTLYASRAAAAVAAERLKTYAQPQRLMILSRLVDGEHTVGEIEEATGIGQPALSQQLAELRRAEIVKTRRVSKLVYYRLADEKVITCVRSIEAMFGDGPAYAIAPSISVATTPSPKLGHRLVGAASFVKFDSI
ncbi:ArsR/SmtB family transcription factor [Tardiphaga sp.]|uniref:ArsR/SmtB family transcription factor n=1 Tax=Tardiphaga sp. TaxID=1926292 RepID=UPI00352B1A3C